MSHENLEAIGASRAESEMRWAEAEKARAEADKRWAAGQKRWDEGLAELKRLREESARFAKFFGASPEIRSAIMTERECIRR